MLNNKVKFERVALSMTQKDLAKKVGVTRQTISLIEQGDYNPSLALCKKICFTLGKSLDELFGEDMK
ncbi:helix-turn-helix transcriptional regulator [Staphylococcus pseudintermedius]|nr:helix-turn-helix transcriptional regulator [Staphylococcus pseudintermedius]HEC2213153.1 helix-turn-helix transcriptional regulator [Staphylococcus delphini]EHT8062873.1 helix-turn-helix transcriptional regulator [Staphylococcus pseudintermedius]EHT8094127.1 helix-turn-helix transcriptional regulator [Staphylococcus pseudintermedius]EHT8096587.1 helix-turn-helix transcriptional regulator [Staphylococcus pseudintermedius]